MLSYALWKIVSRHSWSDISKIMRSHDLCVTSASGLGILYVSARALFSPGRLESIIITTLFCYP